MLLILVERLMQIQTRSYLRDFINLRLHPSWPTSWSGCGSILFINWTFFFQGIFHLNVSQVKKDHTDADPDSNHVEEDNIHPDLFNWLIYPCWAGADNIPHVLFFISAWLLHRRLTRPPTPPCPREAKRASKWIVCLRYPRSNFTLCVWGFLVASFGGPPPSPPPLPTPHIHYYIKNIINIHQKLLRRAGEGCHIQMDAP